MKICLFCPYVQDETANTNDSIRHYTEGKINKKKMSQTGGEKQTAKPPAVNE